MGTAHDSFQRAITTSTSPRDTTMANTTTLMVSNLLMTLGWARPISFATGAAAIILVLVLQFAANYIIHSGEPKKSHRLPPGPTSWPIVMFLKMITKKPRFRWILALAEGKDITCIRIGTMHTIVVNSPELAREFLKSHDASFASRPVFMGTEYSSRGFLSLAVSPWGDQWKKMRRVLASEVLNPRRLQWTAKLRHEEADHLVRYLYNKCKESKAAEIINVREAVYYYSGNMIRRMLFGRRHFGDGGRNGGPGVEELEHVEAAFTVLSLIYCFCVSDFMPCLRWLDLDGHERKMKENLRVIDKYHDPIIDERVEFWRGEEKQDQEPKDLLDIMISLKDSCGMPVLTPEEIKAQVAELILATVDNPSNMVEWALAEILNQPNILHKAMSELDRVVGKDRMVQELDIPQLTYIRACVRESARLHPVSAFNLPHVSICDATVAGYFIPKGSQVLLSRVGLGRNPKVWSDPLRFNPDRHISVDGSSKVELAEPELRFISFTTGRRGCMGATLGSLMTYILLARLLQAFEWSIADGEMSVDLSEEKTRLFLAEPLHACVKPRLHILDK